MDEQRDTLTWQVLTFKHTHTRCLLYILRMCPILGPIPDNHKGRVKRPYVYVQLLVTVHLLFFVLFYLVDMISRAVLGVRNIEQELQRVLIYLLNPPFIITPNY